MIKWLLLISSFGLGFPWLLGKCLILMHKIVSLDAECASYHMMILIARLSGMLASYFNEKIKDCQVILHSVWSIFGNHMYVILKKRYAVHCKRYQFSFVCLMSDYFYMMCLWLQDIILTHWGRDKMAAFLQTTLSNAFSWMKILVFRLKIHRSLFLRVLLTILQHWFW